MLFILKNEIFNVRNCFGERDKKAVTISNMKLKNHQTMSKNFSGQISFFKAQKVTWSTHECLLPWQIFQNIPFTFQTRSLKNCFTLIREWNFRNSWKTSANTDMWWCRIYLPQQTKTNRDAIFCSFHSDFFLLSML